MEDTTWWWIALAAGLVVAVVAVALLQTLLVHVRRIEDLAQQIWHTGKLVAGNTANTWQLESLSGRLDTLAEEAERHAAVLDYGTRGRRTSS